MKTVFVLPLALVASLLSGEASAGNARDEFSLNTNPNGAWSYGSSATLGGTYLPLINKFTSGSQAYWYGADPAFGGSAGYPIIGITSTQPPAGELVEHPGPLGEYAVLRWTAPVSGAASIVGKFSVGDAHPTTTDVHILLNGTPLMAGVIDGSSTVTNFSHVVSLSAGDKVDFSIGYGSNGNYLFDSTFVLASVNAVPEPSTFAFLLAGLGFFAIKAKMPKSRKPSE